MTSERTTPLSTLLRDAAADLAAQQPPPDLQARVLAATELARLNRRTALAAPTAASPAPRAAKPGTGAPFSSRWAWSGAAVCAVVLMGSALLMLRPPATPLVDDAVRMGGFFPLVPPERWPSEAAPAWLVSTELPGERLAAMGLPYDPARAGDSVRAELLLHPSGEVLAVRFLR